MLPREAWRALEGSVLQDGVVLRELVDLQSSAVFRAKSASSQPLLVRFWDSEYADPHLVVNRHREAAFFDGPGLLKCLYSGLANSGDRQYAYAVYEAPEAILTDELRAAPRTVRQAQELATDLAEALENLHSKGFVYCALDPWTVCKRNGRWVLSDYSQLRLSGEGYARETRRLLALFPTAPPEAFEGHVTPPWDAWGLAHLMRTCLLGPQQKPKPGERRSGIELPGPLADVLSACTTMDPAERCTVREVAEKMRALPDQAPIVPPAPAEYSTPAAPEPPPPPRRPMLYMEEEKPPSRRRLAVMALAGFVTVLLLFLVLGGGRRNQAQTPPAQPPASAAGTPSALDIPVGTQPESAVRTGDTRSRAGDDDQIRRLVDRWSSSYRSGDLATHMSLYAPEVDRFFLKRNMTAEQVEKVKQEALASGGEVRRYDIDNVQTKIQSPTNATVTLDKTYEFASGRKSAGKVRSELSLRKINESWRIVGERDVRVYWQKRS